jgi:hypothetical protein
LLDELNLEAGALSGGLFGGRENIVCNFRSDCGAREN